MFSMIWHAIYSWVFGFGGLGAIIAAAAWALWFFCPAFLLTYKTQLLNIAIGATVFAVVSTYFYTHGFNAGYKVAIHAIAAQDQKAVDAANAAKTTVDDCVNNGNIWSVENGSCDKP
jgi:hypothetical protein